MISLCAFSMDFCTILYRADAFTSPCLYVGTSLGSCLVIVLQLPQEGESRRTQPVIVSPSGNTYYFLFKTKIGVETTLLVVFIFMIVNVIPTSPPWSNQHKNPCHFLSGTIFRLQGAILGMSFLDSNGLIIPSISEQWRDEKERKYTSKLQSKYTVSL